MGGDGDKDGSQAHHGSLSESSSIKNESKSSFSLEEASFYPKRVPKIRARIKFGP